MFFRGHASLSLDAKGRMVLPSRYRDLLSAENENMVVISIDIQMQCLTMHPFSEWQEMEKKLMTMPSLSPATKKLQRMILGNAFEQELDGSGRITLPPALRSKIGLEKKIRLVGQGHKFEIWDEATWDAQFDEWKEDGPLSLDDLPDAAKDMVF